MESGKPIFLEKPISANPKSFLTIFKIFHKKKINYSFGFLFEYVSWYKLIKKKLNTSKKKNIILIKWNIKKDLNESKSWKYNFHEGGGLLRYYGIHFIRLFSDLNFNIIKDIKINKNFLKFLINDKNNNTIMVILKFSKNSYFSYKINNLKIKKFPNPFLNKINSKFEDPRCFFLKKYIRKNLFNYKNNFLNDLLFLNLWNKVENNNKDV